MQRVCCHLSITLVVYLLLPAAAMAQVVIGPGPGGTAPIQYIEPAGTRTIDAFPGFLGGVSITLGDVNGDGVVDVIAGAGPGGGPHVRVFSGVDLAELASFFAYDPVFVGGVQVAAGDVDGDGRADIITGAGPGGGPHVQVFSGAAVTSFGFFSPYDAAFYESVLASFFAYDPFFAGGVHVAAGDVNGDGRADIITGAGPGGGPHVQVFNGADVTDVGFFTPYDAAFYTSVVASFFPYDPSFAGGVHVAAGDIDGDGRTDIITGAGPGGGPHVEVFSGADVTRFELFSPYDAAFYESVLGSFFAYDPFFPGGVHVAAGDVNGDGRVDIITGAGPGGGPHVEFFNGADVLGFGFFSPDDPEFYESLLASFFAPDTGSGVSVGSVGDGPGGLRFTSAVTTTFMVGAPGTFTVTTVGNPAPAITSTGALPADVTFVDNGDGTATLAGTPAAGTGGTYTLTFTAVNGGPTPATQSFTLTVTGAPAITSAAATTFPINAPGTFAVTTTGFPIPTITRTGADLPTALTWIDNGDGTGTLDGTAAAGTGGTYVLTFTALNGVGAPAVQTFTLTVNGAPAFTSANAAAFTLNTGGTSFQVVMTGSPAPTVSVTAGVLPTGLTLSSAGLLSGTPTQSGSFPVTLTATNGTLPNATQSFTVVVNAPPAITSGNTDTFTVGTADSFTVTTTGFPAPTVSQTGALPAGVMFTAATRVLGGTPTQTGVFPLVFTATNGTPPDATQNFTLNVVCPAIVVNPATITDGLYQVAHAGVTFTQTGSTGSSITWSATGLPAGVTIGATTGVVSGVPTNTVLNGAVVIIATDNFGCQGTHDTTMTVRPTTDPENHMGGVGHTQYATGAPFPATPHVAFVDNVKTGDNGPAPLFVTFPATSTNGGAIVEGATDGTFIYTPALNFGGPSDTFTYTLTDANGVTNTGTVTINLSNIVWYVNSSGGAGDGRSHSPFNTLNAAATPSGSTHIIYVHSGGATTTGNLTMDANQTLQGQGATFTLNGLTIPAGTRPTLTGTVTVADNTTVRAVNFTPSGIPAMAASAVSFAQPVTIDQVNVTGGTSALSLTNVTATATGAINVSNAAFTNTSAAEVLISQGTIPVTLAATATISSNAGRSVDVQNRTGGTVTFSGAITDTGQGVFLNANTGSTINFTGGLSLSTTTNPGFTATGGGTVSATQNNTTIVNTITATTGTALNVANTNIGSSGLTFRNISAGTGAGSAGNALVLDNTGTAAGNGGLTVTGNAGAGTGGTIQHKTGANGLTTQGIGIYLNQTKNASFSWMQLNHFDNFAIRGNELNGLTLSNVVVSGTSGNDAGSDEGAVLLEDSGGTIAITNSNVSGGFEDNLRVDYNNAVAGPAATFNVSGSTFHDLQAAGQNAQVNLRSQTSAGAGWVVALNFTSNTFENDANTLPPGGTENWSDGILVTFEGPFAHDLTVENSTFHHLFQGMDIASNFSADVDYVIRNNNITFTEGVAAIAIGNGSSSTAQSFLTALIQGNTIGTSGVAQSGNRLGQGIVVDVRGEETAQFTIHGNTVRRIEVGGIDVLANTGDGDLHIQITNNVIEQVEDDVGGGISDGIRVLTATGSLHDICLDARNNDSFNIGGADDLQLRQSNAGVVFAIEGLTGSGTTAANVEAFLDGQNPLFTPASGGTRVRTVASVVNFTSVASCTTPTPQ